MRFWLPVLVLAMSGTLAAPRGAGSASRAERAAALFASASRRLAIGTHEQRQFALIELQDAARLDPTRTDIGLALCRVYLEADFLTLARRLARRTTVRDSGNAAAWLLEGQVWRRYWLATIDATARDRAIVCLERSGRLAPNDPKAWALLAPLLVDANELEAAYAVAARAARAAPADAQAQVQLAAAAERLGDLATAERLFHAGIAGLPADLRERYDDVGPLLPPRPMEQYASLDPQERQGYVERFWAEADPDPVSVENEAQLEYWARVTQAVSLYGTSMPGQWDARAQYYVRYGPPAVEEINPITKPDDVRDGDWLAWTYPDFGLRVWMGSPSTFNGFMQPISSRAMLARAAPESLARHDELCALYQGWAVLHRLPPGIEPLETRLALAQFRSGDRPSLLAQAEAPGGPGDSLTVAWVVLDGMSTPVARDQRPMGASACRPVDARAGSYARVLSPGRYAVGVQVSDAFGRRGIIRRNLVATRAPDRLALSDLVVTCGAPAQSVTPGSGVRLEPETGLFPVAGEQVYAYLEIYHLAQSPRGDAQFEYNCSVRPVRRDARGWLSRLFAAREAPPRMQVSRIETTRGAMRRQFLSLPVSSLPGGTYELSVLVRDVANGDTASAVATFERQR